VAAATHDGGLAVGDRALEHGALYASESDNQPAESTAWSQTQKAQGPPGQPCAREGDRLKQTNANIIGLTPLIAGANPASDIGIYQWSSVSICCGTPLFEQGALAQEVVSQ
jgi:hypothetical protein